MKVLVTGATGRIGANLVRELIGAGNDVRAFALPDDPKLSKLEGSGAEVILGDLLDSEAVAAAAEGMEYIAHLGYIMGKPAGMSTATEFDINMTGTFNILEAAAHQETLQRFLFASTNATYDAFHPKYVPMDEVHPQEPHSYYGMEKLAGEKMTESYGRIHGVPWTIVRFGTVPGPDEILKRLSATDVANYLRGFAEDPTSQLFAPGVSNPSEPVDRAIEDGADYIIPAGPDGRSWMQDLVDVRDTVNGIILAMTHENGAGEAFNITGFGVTWEEALGHLAKRTGTGYTKVQLPNTWYWRCDNTKAKSLLGYLPRYTIDRMIDDALSFEKGQDIGVLPA